MRGDAGGEAGGAAQSSEHFVGQLESQRCSSAPVGDRGECAALACTKRMSSSAVSPTAWDSSDTPGLRTYATWEWVSSCAEVVTHGVAQHGVDLGEPTTTGVCSALRTNAFGQGRCTAHPVRPMIRWETSVQASMNGRGG